MPSPQHTAPVPAGPRNRVTASAEIVATAGPGGATRLPVLRSQAPLVLRRTPEAIYLVGAAAGPIAGDLLTLTITVGPGACLRVRTAAASVALPGPALAESPGAESVFTVTADVSTGGRLEYLPEPVVVASGARHATVFLVTLASGASLLLRDELILGRHREPGGFARGLLSVDYAGRPLLRQALEVGGTDEASRGPAILAGHRAVGALLCAGRDCGAEPEAPAVPAAGLAPRMTVTPERMAVTPKRAAMPLAGPGVLVTALADDAVTLRRRLHETDANTDPRQRPSGNR